MTWQPFTLLWFSFSPSILYSSPSVFRPIFKPEDKDSIVVLTFDGELDSKPPVVEIHYGVAESGEIIVLGVGVLLFLSIWLRRNLLSLFNDGTFISLESNMSTNMKSLSLLSSVNSICSKKYDIADFFLFFRQFLWRW